MGSRLRGLLCIFFRPFSFFFPLFHLDLRYHCAYARTLLDRVVRFRIARSHGGEVCELLPTSILSLDRQKVNQNTLKFRTII